ncbi:MAG: TatD family hydrolase [Bacteroidota bacterium]
MLIDTHAHLYLDRFDADREAMIARAKAAGVTRIVLPAIDVASIHKAIALSEQYDGVWAMAAIHPSEVKDATDADFDAVRELCTHPKVIAVGESGLDYYWDRSFDAKQHNFLRRHIHLTLDTELPLIIHSRDKAKGEVVFPDLIATIDEVCNARPDGDQLRGIFHCFGGPTWVVDEAKRLGFLLGIGGTLTFKNSGVADVVAEIPMEQLVLETDAPFLSPTPHRGKRNESAYTRLVAEKLAEVKGVSLEEVAAVTTANAERLFGLSRSAG